MTTSPTTKSKSSTEPRPRGRRPRRPPLAGRSRRSGFTLLELLLVLAIVGGLTALAWPRLARLSRALEVRASARDLVALAGRARLEALSRREPVELRLAAERICVVRPQARRFPSDSAGEADSSQQGEVTILEYALSPAVVLARLQVRPADRAALLGEDEGSPGNPAAPPVSAGESDQNASVINFYPDGTSDDALIGLRSADASEPGGPRTGARTPGSAAEPCEYYVVVRGLLGRATVVRHLSETDERLFVEVPDVGRY